LLENAARETGANVVFVERASPALAAVIKDADIIHCQTPSLDVAVFAKLFRKPLVMTIFAWRRGGFHLHALQMDMAWWLADRRWYISRYVWDTWEPRRRKKNSEQLPCVSDLPCGVIPPGQRKGFVFIARWIPNKGVDTLVDAYARAKM